MHRDVVDGDGGTRGRTNERLPSAPAREGAKVTPLALWGSKEGARGMLAPELLPLVLARSPLKIRDAKLSPSRMRVQLHRAPSDPPSPPSVPSRFLFSPSALSTILKALFSWRFFTFCPRLVSSSEGACFIHSHRSETSPALPARCFTAHYNVPI